MHGVVMLSKPMQLTGHRNKFPQKLKKSLTSYLIQTQLTEWDQKSTKHTQDTDDNISTLVAPHSSVISHIHKHMQ